MDRQITFEILLYLNMFYTMFYAGIETFFFFMKYLYVPDFGNFCQALVPSPVTLDPNPTLNQSKIKIQVQLGLG